MQSLSQLLEKYDVPGPRYTSYPTVPYWKDVPGAETWAHLLKEEQTKMSAQGKGAALYLHLPFCSSLCTFCACNRIITRKTERNAKYIETLLAEWKLYENVLGDAIPVKEIHLGGGTPTFFSPEELTHLLSNLLKRVNVLPGAELSLEADPRVTSVEHMKAL
ncbi:MAG: coproporphyrinogen III oxidase, partial [Alphaproteobacteria bacterium CG_4_10_14_0_8_um_filter_53_9]